MAHFTNLGASLKALRSILDGLEQLVNLERDSAEHLHDDEQVRDHERELLDRAAEEAIERGLEEESTDRLVRIILTYVKKEAE